MPALNYHLACQMADERIDNIDIDVYQGDHCLALPNAINSATGRFVIPLTMKELLYLDGNGLAELAKRPKPEDSLILARRIPAAAEWFAEALADFEKKQRRQDQLRKLMLEKGWEIPPCIRRLQSLRLYDDVRLEAYRVLSQFYSWIKASHAETRHLIYRVDQRNPIKDYQRLSSIITYAIENLWFVGCEHPLLQRFCPAGKCFLAELIKEYGQPRLFEHSPR
jgi:hypothetical protein